MYQRRGFVFVVIALACVLYVATTDAQTRRPADPQTGRIRRVDLSGVAIERINSRLLQGRVVEVSPPLT